MLYEEFTKEVQTKLTDILGDGFEVTPMTTTKNNGTEKRGVCVRAEGTAVAPVLYLEDYWQQFEYGNVNIDEIVNDILRLYSNNRSIDLYLDRFADWYFVKDRIFTKVINGPRNEEMLKDLPHYDIVGTDLVMIYSVFVGISNGNMASVTVTKQHKDIWDVGILELNFHAVHNSPVLLPPWFVHINQVLDKFGLPLPPDTDSPLYILSNTERLNGAAALWYEGQMDLIAKELKTDKYYILPSSIHEVLILPYSEDLDPEELKKMVHEVNRTELMKEDILSDSVFLYSNDTRIIRSL